jgi:hypothetical protein
VVFLQQPPWLLVPFVPLNCFQQAPQAVGMLAGLVGTMTPAMLEAQAAEHQAQALGHHPKST